MKIESFKLERYFGLHEFSAKYLLSSSDCDGYSVDYVLNCANAQEKELWSNLKLGYSESYGSPWLREAIAKHYKTITPEETLVLSPGEANFIIMNVALERGDHAICLQPSYQSLYQVAKSIGCEVTFWKPDPVTWHYNPDDLEKLVKSNTKLLIINFPHNPTGSFPSRQEVDKIISFARRHNLIIFSDEMYFQMVHNPANEIPSFCDLYENAVSLWGMAKSFGLAGLRIGWVASKNKNILSEIIAFKDYLTICSSAMSEVLAVIALNHKEKFIDRNLEKIRKNLTVFSDFHREHRDFFEYPMPTAGSTAFIKLKINESSLDYCNRLVHETGIMLLPSEMFEAGDKHARIGFGRESLPETLSLWSSYIKKGVSAK